MKKARNFGGLQPTRCAPSDNRLMSDRMGSEIAGIEELSRAQMICDHWKKCAVKFKHFAVRIKRLRCRVLCAMSRKTTTPMHDASASFSRN
jgi:hypothetical protein